MLGSLFNNSKQYDSGSNVSLRKQTPTKLNKKRPLHTNILYVYYTVLESCNGGTHRWTVAMKCGIR